jgi:phosphate transport system permease protein
MKFGEVSNTPPEGDTVAERPISVQDTRTIISSALEKKAGERGALDKHMRVGESIIRAILLLCGAFSILTTLGIVFVLGKEALLFFTPPAWIDSFKTLAVTIEETDTTFEIEGAAGELEIGQRIKIVNEEMLVTAVSEDGITITVERGYKDTTPEAHNKSAEIYLADDISLIEYFTSTEWFPQLGKFGVLPLLNSTLITTIIAMMVALPLGLSAAIYLSEYAAPKARAILKPILEILAGVPTVVYGYFALTFMTPLLQNIFGSGVQVYNTASAGIVMGIMILPYVSSVSEDALSAVPRSLREASYGLGATRFETVAKVVVPAALSGIIAAFILGVSRAIGETMIVALAAGAGPNFTFDPFQPAETMTGHIVRISGGDISYNSIDYNSLFAIGLTLFFMTLALNVISRRITSHFREVYE